MKEDDEEVEYEAEREAKHDHKRQPAIEHTQQAEREQQVEKKHYEMGGARHDESVHSDDDELTLALANELLCVVVVHAESTQLADGQHAEGDLDHNGQQVAQDEDDEQYRFAFQR